MNENVGPLDRVVRTVVGLALITWLLVAQGPVRWWGLIGAVLLWSAWVGFCPLYRLLGLSSHRAEPPLSSSPH